MPLSDSLQDMLGQIGQSLKKLPTAIAGGGVDIGNMLLGGYAGIGEALQGKSISRSVGEGLVKKPAGGSEQLNEFFGLDNKSGGLTEDSASAMLAALNPAAAIKTAMIVPAMLLKSATTVKLAETALNKGMTAAKVFEHTGVYKDPADGMLKAVLSDANAELKTSGANVSNGIEQYATLSKAQRDIGPSQILAVRGQSTLGDVLDHPELFKAMPELAKVKVSGNTNPKYQAAYHAYDDRIDMSPYSAPKDFLSDLLHETQHAVQFKSDFATGANTSMFYRNPKEFTSAALKANAEETAAYDALDAGKTSTADLLAAMNSSRLSSVLQGAQRKASANYMNTAGEKEARVVQEQFLSGDYSKSPLDISAGSTGPLISDPQMGNKVDTDPLVRAVINYFNKP